MRVRSLGALRPPRGARRCGPSPASSAPAPAGPEDGAGGIPAPAGNVAVGAFAVYVAFGTSFQVLPPFLDEVARRWALSHYLAGLAMPAFLVPALVAAVPAGILVDRHGAIPLVRLGFGALLAGGAMVAGAPTFPLFLLGRVLEGLGGGVAVVAALRVVATATPRSRLGTAMGVFVAGLPVGTGIAFDILGPLAHYTRWRSAVTGSELIVLASFAAVTSVLRDAPPGKREGDREERGRPEGAGFLRLLLLVLLGYAVIVGFTTWAPTKIAEYGRLRPGDAVLIASLLLVIDIPLSPLWGVVVDRVGRYRPFIAAAFLVYGTGAVALPAVASPGIVSLVGLLLLVAAMGVGCSMFFPATLASLPSLVTRDKVGSGYGALVAAQVAGMALGPPVFGAVFDRGGAAGGFWTMGAVAVVVAVVAVWPVRTGPTVV
jgi:ACS family hexuronate transporter-like MFS transporter